jgi:hypothetical protein
MKLFSFEDVPHLIENRYIKWRKRWRKQHDAYEKQAPRWWAEFFANEFLQALWETELYI